MTTKATDADRWCAWLVTAIQGGQNRLQPMTEGWGIGVDQYPGESL